MGEFNDIVQKIFTKFPEEFNGPFGSDKQTYRAFYELRDWINNTICNDKPPPADLPSKDKFLKPIEVKFIDKCLDIS